MAAGNGVQEQESETPSKASPAQPTKSNSDKTDTKSPAKKRRKVNHACIYCRRSHMTCDLERPCTRCIKRNIGHLCHDEPREPAKKGKAEGANIPVEVDTHMKDSPEHTAKIPPPLDLAQMAHSRITSNAPLVQPTPIPASHRASLSASNSSMINGFQQDWSFNNQSHSHLISDIHHLHPSYTFTSSDLGDEYNLLNNFLNNSLLEDGGLYGEPDANGMFPPQQVPESPANFTNTSPTFNRNANSQMRPPSRAAVGNSISRPASSFPIDKAQETYYLTAADPAGSDPPEERLKKLLKAKYDAGLLKPFNYVKGYARLNTYMERNLSPISRMKILRHIDKFRPKFRERVKELTDMQLTMVEMGFERSLMEYDRVFASMAIPACCWRRTGEIFRGNKEMAELIHVPLDKLKDGKIAIHEIFAENSLVSYWEKFGAIAFDSSQKAILTTCALMSQSPQDKEKKAPEMRCCFSFTIKRDQHNIPYLIVGNFLPILPPNAPS